uniref:F54F2.7 n=1 Tax=Caligus clemensi TaxID=344056 RepID=C1C2J9_CALCM|nr:F54F2.7 [Caligus clemensi]
MPLTSSSNDKELTVQAEVKRIEDSFVLCPRFPSVGERYYEKYYYRDPDRTHRHDQIICVHSNRLVLISLAPRHGLFSKEGSFTVDYRVTPKCDRSANSVRGKGKKGAQELSPEANLCVIKPQEGEEFFVKALVKGKLVEVNKSLLNDPQALKRYPQGQGFIALILPNLPEGLAQLKATYLSEKEYYCKEKYDPTADV